jgi:dephospho-CoA kinase
VAVLEAALLLQWSAPKLVDFVIGVWAPRETRLARLVAGGLDAREAALRVDVQVADDELRRRADVLVDNTAGLEALRSEVDRLAGELRRRAAKS